MLEQIIEPTLLTQFKEALENSGNVVVTCHKSPDGDAAGSNLALKLILDKLGKKATVVTPDNVPEDMAFLPGYDNIVIVLFAVVVLFCGASIPVSVVKIL